MKCTKGFSNNFCKRRETMRNDTVLALLVQTVVETTCICSLKNLALIYAQAQKLNPKYAHRPAV